ncbi:MAG: hypothetical protein GY769_11420 [bacterium]|nr:hypothetical protein [bacterium]
MKDDRTLLEQAVDRILAGKDIYVGPDKALEDLDWETAGKRPDGSLHSVLELVNHMACWMRWVVKWLDGKEPEVPEHADGSWPGSIGPASPAEWEAALAGFFSQLDALNRAGLA